MTPNQLMETVGITDPEQHRDVRSLVGSLGRDLEREKAIASSCGRLLADTGANAEPRKRARLEKIRRDALNRAELLQEYVDWGESLLRSAAID